MSLKWSLPRWPVLLLLPGLSATVHEWQAMRAEYAAEFDRARWMDTLDCAGLDAYVAQQRWQMIQRINAEYQGMLPRTSGVPGIPPAAVPPRTR
jgi:hypothetical protein